MARQIFFSISSNLCDKVSMSWLIFWAVILAYARVTPKKLFEDMDKYIEATKDLKLIL